MTLATRSFMEPGATTGRAVAAGSSVVNVSVSLEGQTYTTAVPVAVAAR